MRQNVLRALLARIEVLVRVHVRLGVETVVKAVEQMYQDLSGREKLEKAKENILVIL